MLKHTYGIQMAKKYTNNKMVSAMTACLLINTLCKKRLKKILILSNNIISGIIHKKGEAGLLKKLFVYT
jgi:hypothetical protein